MSNKELVIDTVRRLPANASLEDIAAEIKILAGIKRGERAAKAGRVVSHDKVKKLIGSWNTK